MKLMLTGAFKYTEKQLEIIESLGYKIVYVPDEREPLDIDVSDIDGIVCNGLFLYNSIEKFKGLKFIQLTSAGYDRVPIDYIRKHKIKIFNARGVYSSPMAEFALCGVLQIIKQSAFFIDNKENHRWEKSRTLGELGGKSVLIFGAGSIGTQVAKRFSAFDCNIVGIDTNADEKQYFDSVNRMEFSEELLPMADIVVATIPLTEQTKGMFDKKVFDLMKPTSIFVNIARGALVNENDMIKALKENRIFGAVLDVFEKEPLDATNPLWDMDNVVLTPHNSFVGENNNQRLFSVIIKNLKDTN